ncbi:MAG: DUF763 domain-containing protein [Thermoplasmatota archaeon]
MPRTGVADLPLHGGSAPRWLFTRMVKMADAICEVIIEERGTEELLRRLSDPYWFQAFSCVLGFDWHSSGTTTVTCGALKEALRDSEVGVAGGKGKASRSAQTNIHEWSESQGLSPDLERRFSHSSRMSAKVDSAAVQDGHELYHHTFLFDQGGNWATIQQGMADHGYARRYHWFSGELRDFVQEPHSAILGTRSETLDMTASASSGSRRTSVDLVKDGPDHLRNEVVNLSRGQTTLYQWSGQPEIRLCMPGRINWKAMSRAYEFQPRGYEELLGIQGMGPATVRALALIGELVYGSEPSWRDPVKYSFAVGGKDGVPYPVDRRAMDESTRLLFEGIEESKVGRRDKLRAVSRLRDFVPDDVD